MHITRHVPINFAQKWVHKLSTRVEVRQLEMKYFAVLGTKSLPCP